MRVRVEGWDSGFESGLGRELGSESRSGVRLGERSQESGHVSRMWVDRSRYWKSCPNRVKVGSGWGRNQESSFGLGPEVGSRVLGWGRMSKVGSGPVLG